MKLRVATLLVFLAVMLLWLVPPRVASTTSRAAHTTEPQRRARQTPRRSAAARADYTNFSHATAQHRKSCDSCHKFPSQNWQQARAKDAAFPDITEYPQHSSCLDCHRQQFFARERPVPIICSVCHVNATPRHTVRWPFPSLGPQFDASPKGRVASSDFAVNFPHAKHEGLFSQLRLDSESSFRFVRASFARTRAARQNDPAKANAACATCHLTQQPQGDSEDEFLTKPPKGLPEEAFWPKKGMYKTSPRDHATCFTCHSQESGVAPAPTDCNACHKLLPVDERVQLARAHGDYDPKLAAGVGITDRPTLLKWARRDASRFRHEWPPHDLACVTCHNVATMNTADEKTRKVPIMSCGGGDGGCHVTATVAEGGTLNVAIEKKKADPNFQCAKCHVLLGKEPVPASHTNAVTAGAAKPK
jgi:hypothetical protein